MRYFRSAFVLAAVIIFATLFGCDGNNDSGRTQADTTISSSNAVLQGDLDEIEESSDIIDTGNAFYIPESSVEAPNAKIRKPMPPRFGKGKMLYPMCPGGFSIEYTRSNLIYLINEQGEEISPTGETYQQVYYVYDDDLHVQGIVAMKLVYTKGWEVTLFNRSGDIILSFDGDCTVAPPGCGAYIVCFDMSYNFRVYDVVKEKYVSNKIFSTWNYPEGSCYFVEPGKFALFEAYPSEPKDIPVYDIASKKLSAISAEDADRMTQETGKKAYSLLPGSKEYGMVVADGLYYWGEQGSYYGYRDKDGNWFWRDFVYDDYND